MSEIDARELQRSSTGTDRASTIYDYTCFSVESLWDAFELAKSERGNRRGITTDQEQDLLRAMLVMAASGLDSALKQLIRDCTPELIGKSETIHKKFEKFTLRELQGGRGDSTGESNPKFLAKILSSASPQTSLIEAYVYDLTGSSLQSANEVLKVADAFSLNHKDVVSDVDHLKGIFQVRNKIIHELDIDLDAARRKRNVRRQNKMKADTEYLLEVAANVIEKVDEKMAA